MLYKVQNMPTSTINLPILPPESRVEESGTSHLPAISGIRRMAIKRAIELKPGTFLKKIGVRKTSREYRNNQKVYSQGDAANSLYYVDTGNVKLTVQSKRGKKAVIGILQAGEF